MRFAEMFREYFVLKLILCGIREFGILSFLHGPLLPINILVLFLRDCFHPEMEYLRPVSYTHLDVYKRQVLTAPHRDTALHTAAQRIVDHV